MRLEKLTRAIKSAMGYLEDSMKVVSKGNDEDVSGLVWRAAADLEYALFLFSIMHQDESESSSWKLGLHSKDVEIDSALASTRDLLKEATSIMKAGEIREAHKKTWMARGYLLRLQEFFEKKRKLQKAVKKSS
ncbi:MAG: hypothetical protein ACE5IF_04420 [Candidatus Bathyarchaeia archaeon]